jgi:hypothetical protein
LQSLPASKRNSQEHEFIHDHDLCLVASLGVRLGVMRHALVTDRRCAKDGGRRFGVRLALLVAECSPMTSHRQRHRASMPVQMAKRQDSRLI